MVWKPESDPPVDLEKGEARKKEAALFMDPWKEKVLMTFVVVCTVGLGFVCLALAIMTVIEKRRCMCQCPK
ncbi:hypothetical protein ACP4OV_002290 [Aristida adscensionis]